MLQVGNAGEKAAAVVSDSAVAVRRHLTLAIMEGLFTTIIAAVVALDAVTVAVRPAFVGVFHTQRILQTPAAIKVDPVLMQITVAEQEATASAAVRTARRLRNLAPRKRAPHKDAKRQAVPARQYVRTMRIRVVAQLEVVYPPVAKASTAIVDPTVQMHPCHVLQRGERRTARPHIVRVATAMLLEVVVRSIVQRPVHRAQEATCALQMAVAPGAHAGAGGTAQERESPARDTPLRVDALGLVVPASDATALLDAPAGAPLRAIRTVVRASTAIVGVKSANLHLPTHVEALLHAHAAVRLVRPVRLVRLIPPSWNHRQQSRTGRQT